MLEFDQYYSQLNPKQKEAVDSIEGPVVVIAGAGTGKTQLLGTRAANILRLTDTLPSQILCLTFTDTASTNMKLRLQKMIGADATKIQVYTFHSFAGDIINQYPQMFHQGFSFAPTDELLSSKILHDVFDSLASNHPLNSYHPLKGWTYLSDVKKAITDLKQAGLSPDQFKEIIQNDTPFLQLLNSSFVEFCKLNIKALKPEHVEALNEAFETASLNGYRQHEMYGYPTLVSAITKEWAQARSEYYDLLNQASKKAHKSLMTFRDKWKPSQEKVLRDFLNIDKMLGLADVYEQYQQGLFANAKFDFDDMLLDVVNALRSIDSGNIALKQDLQERFLYIMVDEFQDTNHVQMELIKILSDSPFNEGNPNIMVVGDDDQAIYKFQKATLKNLSEFIASYPQARQIVLETNYRSNQQVIDFAQVFSHQVQSRITPGDAPKKLTSFQNLD
jgi:DNA helicase-2/ATP-dependent DNA helicase PcrA